MPGSGAGLHNSFIACTGKLKYPAREPQRNVVPAVPWYARRVNSCKYNGLPGKVNVELLFS